MKSTLSHIIFLLFMLCLAQAPLHAQESPDYEHVNGYDDKSEHEIAPDFYTEPDGRGMNTTPKTQPVKDSSSVRLQAQRLKSGQETKDGKPENKPQGQSGPEDDSILSFNFLYYIIQKFKMQDIIE
jgi:hypothetical protein